MTREVGMIREAWIPWSFCSFPRSRWSWRSPDRHARPRRRRDRYTGVPRRVQLGKAFEATVTIGNPGPDRVQVGNIELVPACAPARCPEAGIFVASPTSRAASGPGRAGECGRSRRPSPGFSVLCPASVKERSSFVRDRPARWASTCSLSATPPTPIRLGRVQTVPTVRATANGLPVGGSDQVSVFPR